MRISAALASYNGEEYIERMLLSILEQTRSVDEVIVTDDCSSDRTVEIVRGFIESHGLDGWKCIVNEKNLGYAENFRHAIECASGDLIFLCDQDDVWVKDRVEVMAGAMERDDKIMLLNTDYVVFSRSESEADVDAINDKSSCVPKRIELDRKTFFLKYPGCVMCVRKAFYEKFKENWDTGVAQDDFLWNMAMHAGACYSMDYCSLMRRVHSGQTSGHVGHTRSKRIAYLTGVKLRAERLFELAENDRQRRLYEKIVKTHTYRLELVRDRKLTRALRLPFYLGYYNFPKSYLTELMIALRGGE